MSFIEYNSIINNYLISKYLILKYDAENTHQFYLEDNLSKFGTLVLQNNPIELEVDQTQAVQIGRSVISFTVKEVKEDQDEMMA